MKLNIDLIFITLNLDILYHIFILIFFNFFLLFKQKNYIQIGRFQNYC